MTSYTRATDDFTQVGPYSVTQAGPTYFRPSVTPTIGGVSTPVVAINGGAAAGSQHIEDASPALAEILAEQIRWQFASSDVVKKIQVGLNTQQVIVTALASTAAEAEKTPEAAYLKVTVNPGDDVAAATRLLNGYPEVFLVYPGETLELESDTTITDVYVIAALATGTVLQNLSKVDCMGVSYA